MMATGSGREQRSLTGSICIGFSTFNNKVLFECHCADFCHVHKHGMLDIQSHNGHRASLDATQNELSNLTLPFRALKPCLAGGASSSSSELMTSTACFRFGAMPARSHHFSPPMKTFKVLISSRSYRLSKHASLVLQSHVSDLR